MSVLACEQKANASIGSSTPIRVGVVSYLNTRPLVAGLSGVRGWTWHAAPPSSLIDLLANDQVDLALCSSIDLLRAPFDPVWAACGPLACCGETRTVRLFARRPLNEVRSIGCDPDSHTSVALLKVLLAEAWKLQPTLHPLSDEVQTDAQLLIGDKVMAVEESAEADQWPVQIDLGKAWHEHTGLPFVFAVWMARQDRADVLRRASCLIDRQLRLNIHRLEQVVSDSVLTAGWTYDTAMSYLQQHIHHEFGPKELTGMQRFLDSCRTHGIAPDRACPAPISGVPLGGEDAA